MSDNTMVSGIEIEFDEPNLDMEHSTVMDEQQ